MNYKFKWKRRFIWHAYLVSGHAHDERQDKMVLYLYNGCIREIKNWKNCEVSLGLDWKMAQQKALEEKSGGAVPLKI